MDRKGELLRGRSVEDDVASAEVKTLREARQLPLNNLGQWRSSPRRLGKQGVRICECVEAADQNFLGPGKRLPFNERAIDDRLNHSKQVFCSVLQLAD